MLTHSSKKPFACHLPSCGRSYCDARSLRRHIDNYHFRTFGPAAAAAFAAGGPTAGVEAGTVAVQELPDSDEPLQQFNSVTDDDESRQLAQLAAYE